MMTMTKVDRERALCQAVTRERAAALTFDLLLASIEHGRGVLSVVSGQLPELWDDELVRLTGERDYHRKMADRYAADLDALR